MARLESKRKQRRRRSYALPLLLLAEDLQESLGLPHDAAIYHSDGILPSRMRVYTDRVGRVGSLLKDQVILFCRLLSDRLHLRRIVQKVGTR